MRSHIGWRGERSIPYKGVETSPQQTRVKIVRLTVIRNGIKRTISTSCGLGLLPTMMYGTMGSSSIMPNKTVVGQFVSLYRLMDELKCLLHYTCMNMYEHNLISY